MVSLTETPRFWPSCPLSPGHRGGGVAGGYLSGPERPAGRRGQLDPHYFLQDLYVARRIMADRPRFHVDVGSRLDGFMAQLSWRCRWSLWTCGRWKSKCPICASGRVRSMPCLTLTPMWLPFLPCTWWSTWAWDGMGPLRPLGAWRALAELSESWGPVESSISASPWGAPGSALIPIGYCRRNSSSTGSPNCA